MGVDRPHVRLIAGFDAAGIFVQWLADSVSKLGVQFAITVFGGPDHRHEVVLRVTHRPAREFVYRWQLSKLDELHRGDGGRGTFLREEIAVRMSDLRKALEGNDA